MVGRTGVDDGVGRADRRERAVRAGRAGDLQPSSRRSTARLLRRARPLPQLLRGSLRRSGRRCCRASTTCSRSTPVTGSEAAVPDRVLPRDRGSDSGDVRPCRAYPSAPSRTATCRSSSTWQSDEESYRMAAVPDPGRRGSSRRTGRGIRINPRDALRDDRGGRQSWSATLRELDGSTRDGWSATGSARSTGGPGIATRGAPCSTSTTSSSSRPLLATVARAQRAARAACSRRPASSLVARELVPVTIGPEHRHLCRAALPARLASLGSTVSSAPVALLDELVQLPVRHPEVGVAPAGVLADAVRLDTGACSSAIAPSRSPTISPIVRSAGPSSSYGGATARTSPFDAAKSCRADAVDGDRRQAEHVAEEGAHLLVGRCVAADEADPAYLHRRSPRPFRPS